MDHNSNCYSWIKITRRRLLKPPWHQLFRSHHRNSKMSKQAPLLKTHKCTLTCNGYHLKSQTIKVRSTFYSRKTTSTETCQRQQTWWFQPRTAKLQMQTCKRCGLKSNLTATLRSAAMCMPIALPIHNRCLIHVFLNNKSNTRIKQVVV